MTTQEIQNLHTVKLHKHLQIPMTDGVELDAHLFLPEEPGQFPVVFDYYPYRKDDLSAGNLRFQQYLAQRGYAALRIDVRGTGSSGVRPATSTRCKNNWTRSKPSPGWPASPGLQARWACLALPMVDLTPYRLPCTARLRSRRSALCISLTIVTPTTVITKAAQCKCSTMWQPTVFRWSCRTPCPHTRRLWGALGRNLGRTSEG